jgi:DNA-binding MarR family transcriptional regulator
MYPKDHDDGIMQEFIKIACMFGSTMRGVKDQFELLRKKNNKLSHHDFRFLYLMNNDMNSDLKLKDGHILSEDPSVHRIAEVFNLTSSTISIKIKDLEEKGYIIHERLADDRRKVKINLSEKAKKMLVNVNGPPILEFQKSIEALTEEEQDQFLPMIKKIVANMKSELGFDDDIDRPEFMRKMFQNTMEG